MSALESFPRVTPFLWFDSNAEEAVEAEADGAADGRRDDRQQWQRDDRPQDRQQGEYRQRDDRPRDDRPRDDRPREDRPRDDRSRDDRYQGDRPGRYPREDRQARYQNDRPNDRQGGRQDFRGERAERDPLGVIEPQATPLVAAQPAPAPAYEPPERQSVLRGEDGATSHAPAFLQSARPEPRADAEDEPAETRKPRRRRAPRTFEPGQAAPAEVDEG